MPSVEYHDEISRRCQNIHAIPKMGSNELQGAGVCQPGSVPVLCYHSVDPAWESPLAMTPEGFAEHCAWLSRSRTVVPVDVLVPRAAEGRRSAGPEVAITFDDGFAAVHQHALPVLRRHRLPTAMFLVARTLHDGSVQDAPARADWLRPQPPVGPKTLSLQQVLELRDAGMQAGSHSWAHADLTTLSEAECIRDLRESRELLEDLLRQPITMLAYPYGFHSPHVRRAAAAAGYEYALALPEGPEPDGTYAVPRVGIYRRNGVMSLQVKCSRWYLGARQSRGYARRRGAAARPKG